MILDTMDHIVARYLPPIAPRTHTTELRTMFPPACQYWPPSSRLTVSMENVDIVVNAPKNPVNTMVLTGPSAYIPYLNIRNDARQHPTMFTMNVAQGNAVSTVR